VNWQVASFLVLAVVLGLGFAWYERSRPSAKVLSLVAARAALATVGRIAFAPIPNVKPTTDIALFAGYALGPVPGFAVGAVAALASNVFFGQGPWTPWQMLAWGGCGAVGAVAAPLLRTRMRSWLRAPPAVSMVPPRGTTQQPALSRRARWIAPKICDRSDISDVL